MTVDYQLEPADFLAFAEDHRRFTPASWSRFYYFGVVPALGVGLAVVTQSFPTAAVFTVLFIGSGWFVQDRIQRAWKRTVYSEENLSLSMHRMTATITDEGIHISSVATDNLYRWPYIRQVFRGSRYVHFELTPLQKIHIPIRAFRDDKHLQEFISRAQSYVKKPAA